MLDEFADGLHFILSLGIDQGYEIDSIDVEDDNQSLTDTLLTTYELTSKFYSSQTKSNYLLAFQSYLRCLFKLGFSWLEAKDAYYLKLEENYKRQETNY